MVTGTKGLVEKPKPGTPGALTVIDQVSNVVSTFEDGTNTRNNVRELGEGEQKKKEKNGRGE